ncbi:FGGY-family carbohydrate kinase [Thermosipho ferrireducens]|uniref:FGGY-family carbohydrate kinase n=1 Tax=Thermosipho ferrireducens TaxID=2571116 RepID=A0ABX7S7V4_9BACT|nr:FGGY-family carbohydrate kinase [Thermosipho ferrireducens]QTA38294.1 FGGY-family carbohydrate kinase [Thermosipho ferrireducens]
MGVALVIDCGTQSLRALLFDKKGKLLDKEKVEFEPYFSLKPGWAEQNVNVYWEALCKATKTLKYRNQKLFEKLLGVSVTTQRDTVVVVDEAGKPLRPAILWLDQRKAKNVVSLKFKDKLLFSVVRMKETVERIYKKTRANWLKENEPEIWRKVHKYLLLSGYLIYKLTGEYVDSKASQIGHIPFDYKKQNWPENDKSFRWRVFGVKREMLPKLAEPCTEIGQIGRKISEETGIPEGTPVILSGSDKGCETLGTGCVDEKCASLSFGTTATVQTTSARYFEPILFMPPYPAVYPGYYNPEIEIFRGYWLISWFKKEFGFIEIEKSKKVGIPAEVLLDHLLDEVPAGSHGLILHPMWTPGLDMPNARGAIIGFSDVHTRAHIYRAIIEGINYALRDGLERIEKKGKVKVKRLTVSGGGSQSDKICQITANMFNLPVCKVQTHETSGLGAAICVFTGRKYYASIEEAVKEMVRYVKVYEPNPEEVRVYERLYYEVYKKVYSSLKRIYVKIKEVTQCEGD